MLIGMLRSRFELWRRQVALFVVASLMLFLHLSSVATVAANSTTAPSTTTSTLTAPHGQIVPVSDPSILASHIASPTSLGGARSVYFIIGGYQWNTSWCQNSPALAAVHGSQDWSRTEGVLAQLGSIVGAGSITCNTTHLILMFLSNEAFFLPWNDTVLFQFAGDYAEPMAADLNPQFTVTFVANQPGAYSSASLGASLPTGASLSLSFSSSSEETGLQQNASDIDWDLLYILSVAATASSFVSSASVGGLYPTVVQKVGLLSHRGCTGVNGSSIPYALDLLPVGLRLADGTGMAVYADALEGNLLVLAGFAVLHVLAVVVATATLKSFKYGMGAVAFPGGLAFAGLQLTAGPIIGNAVVVMLHAGPEVPSLAHIIAYLGLGVCALCILGYSLVVTRFFYARGTPSQLVCSIPLLFAQTVLYTDRSKRRRGFVDSFGRMFINFNCHRQWFATVDLVWCCLTMVFYGLRPTMAQCEERLWIPVLASQALLFFATLFINPLQTLFDRIAYLLLTLSVVGGCVVALALNRQDDPAQWASAIDLSALVGYGLCTLCACITIVVAIAKLVKGVPFRGEACKSDDDSDDEVMKKRSMKKEISEGLLRGIAEREREMTKLEVPEAQNAKERKQQRETLLKKANTNHEEEDPGVAMILLRGEWIRLKDPSTGAPYYYNTRTQDTAWDLRRELGLAPLTRHYGDYTDEEDDDEEDARWRRRQQRKHHEKLIKQRAKERVPQLSVFSKEEDTEKKEYQGEVPQQPKLLSASKSTPPTMALELSDKRSENDSAAAPTVCREELADELAVACTAPPQPLEDEKEKGVAEDRKEEPPEDRKCVKQEEGTAEPAERRADMDSGKPDEPPTDSKSQRSTSTGTGGSRNITHHGDSHRRAVDGSDEGSRSSSSSSTEDSSSDNDGPIGRGGAGAGTGPVVDALTLSSLAGCSVQDISVATVDSRFVSPPPGSKLYLRETVPPNSVDTPGRGITIGGGTTPPVWELSPEATKALEQGEWLQLEDPLHGTTFYYHTRTQHTTKDLSQFLKDTDRGAWRPVQDPSNPSRTLFVNVETKAVRSDVDFVRSMTELLNASNAIGASTSDGEPSSVSVAEAEHDKALTKKKKHKQKHATDELTKKEKRHVKRLLQSGEWVAFVDPLTNTVCYKHMPTGRLSFDLTKEHYGRTDHRHGGHSSHHRPHRHDESRSERGKRSPNLPPTRGGRHEKGGLGTTTTSHNNRSPGSSLFEGSSQQYQEMVETVLYPHRRQFPPRLNPSPYRSTTAREMKMKEERELYDYL